MERQFFSANTIEQAILAAARHFGLDPGRIAYKLRDKKHGFLNVRRRVVIEVDPAAPEISGAAEVASPSDKHVSGGPGSDRSEKGSLRIDGDRSRDGDLAVEVNEDAVPVKEEGGDEDSGGVAREGSHGAGYSETSHARRGARRGGNGVWKHWKAVSDEFAEENDGEEDQEIVAFEKALDEVLELMDLDVEWSVEKQEEVVLLDLEGEDEDLLVEDDGRLLRSIEHLLPRLVRGLLGYGLPCKVDCNEFHASRDLELKELAGGMAESARRQGREQVLEPMNPADRRTVHMTLADDPTVRTESEGDGYMKRVRICPEDPA